jgi:hypothetical protein
MPSALEFMQKIHQVDHKATRAAEDDVEQEI